LRFAKGEFSDLALGKGKNPVIMELRTRTGVRLREVTRNFTGDILDEVIVQGKYRVVGVVDDVRDGFKFKRVILEEAKAKPKRAPRIKLSEAVAEEAAEAGVHPTDLRGFLDDIYESEVQYVREYQQAKEGIHRATNLKASDLAHLENRGFDHASNIPGKLGERVARLDVQASSLAREYPILELGDPDSPTADLTAALWDKLRESKPLIPKKTDPELLRQASQLAYDAGSRSGQSIGQAVELVEEIPF